MKMFEKIKYFFGILEFRSDLFFVILTKAVSDEEWKEKGIEWNEKRMRREYDRIGMKGEGNIMECEGKEIEWNGRVQEKVRRVWESGRISERKKRPRSPSLLGRPIIDICLSISLHYPFFS